MKDHSKPDPKQDPKQKTQKKTEQKEAKFDYSKMDYYEILETIPTANEKQLKIAYLKCAKKYHPDVYNGVNQGHFVKATEAYNILKNPAKRKQYDSKAKIIKMRDNKDYQAMAQKMKMQGKEFTHQMYTTMKKKQQKERVVREDQDPEIMAMWNKMNVDLLFKEFQKRPTRSTVNEMAEDFMATHMEKAMSRKDKARRKFMLKHKREQMIKRSLRGTITAERERFLDIKEQIQFQSSKPLKQMQYDELLEALNKDESDVMLLSGQKGTQLQLFEEEKQMVIQREKEMQELVDNTKKVVYPIYGLAAIVMTLLSYGYYQQDKLIQKDEKKIKYQQKIDSYSFN